MNDPLSISLDVSGPGVPTPLVSLPQRKLLQPSPDHPDDYILELDYSSLSSFLNCPRSYENYAIHSREASRDDSATSFGKLFHSCEELRLLHGYSPEVVQKQRELVCMDFLRRGVQPSDHRTADRMISVLNLYNERYCADMWPQHVLKIKDEKGESPFVERSFKIPLCTIEVNGTLPYSLLQLRSCQKETLDQTIAFGEHSKFNSKTLFVRNLHIFFTGRIDAILTQSNLLWVVDHKTSSRGGGEFESAFRLSLQTRGYCWAAQKLTNLSIAGLIMNAVIVRPLTKSGTGTELDRKTYVYSPDSLAEWEENIKAHVSDLVHCLVRGYWPQVALSFKSPCAMCDYMDNCTLPRDQRALDLESSLYRNVTWSPNNE